MKVVQPEAVLLFHEDDDKLANLRKIYAGFRRCYSASEEAEECPRFKSEEAKAEDFIEKMMKSPHESPLEHAALTFHITCSRAASHQLVRHRIASFSQQSQRYVRFEDIPVIMPPTVKLNLPAKDAFERSVAQAVQDYHDFLGMNIPAEDARYALPNCTATKLVITMNFRSLLHFFEERLCFRAQWEVREIAWHMWEACRRHYPSVFEERGPKCMKLGKCPEAKPCGKIFKRG